MMCIYVTMLLKKLLESAVIYRYIQYILSDLIEAKTALLVLQQLFYPQQEWQFVG